MPIPGSYVYPNPPAPPPAGGGTTPPPATGGGGWWNTILQLLGGDLDKYPGLKERLLARQAAQQARFAQFNAGDKTGFWGGPEDLAKIMARMPVQSRRPGRAPYTVPGAGWTTTSGPPAMPAPGPGYVYEPPADPRTAQAAAAFAAGGKPVANPNYTNLPYDPYQMIPMQVPKGFNAVDPVNPASTGVNYGMGAGSVAGSSYGGQAAAASPAATPAAQTTNWLSSYFPGWGR